MRCVLAALKRAKMLQYGPVKKTSAGGLKAKIEHGSGDYLKITAAGAELFA
jgi:hypothetical protein